jgi:hypothetical protein
MRRAAQVSTMGSFRSSTAMPGDVGRWMEESTTEAASPREGLFTEGTGFNLGVASRGGDGRCWRTTGGVRDLGHQDGTWDRLGWEARVGNGGRGWRRVEVAIAMDQTEGHCGSQNPISGAVKCPC